MMKELFEICDNQANAIYGMNFYDLPETTQKALEEQARELLQDRKPRKYSNLLEPCDYTSGV